MIVHKGKFKVALEIQSFCFRKYALYGRRAVRCSEPSPASKEKVKNHYGIITLMKALSSFRAVSASASADS